MLIVGNCKPKMVGCSKQLLSEFLAVRTFEIFFTMSLLGPKEQNCVIGFIVDVFRLPDVI